MGLAEMPVPQKIPLDPKAASIRVALVDDHPIVREGLIKLLGLEGDIEIVGEASDGREVLALLEEKRPDVLLLDLRMPHVDGLETLQMIQRSEFKVKVIILTASEDKAEYIQAMKYGCAGIVLKQIPPEQIAQIIRKVNCGEIWLDSRSIFPPAPQSPGGRPEGEPTRAASQLSQRELELARLVAKGCRNREIAAQMKITEQTVKNHLHNVFDKLGVSDRYELSLYVMRNGLYTGE